MTDVRHLVADLRSEQEALDDVVAAISPERWALPTPSAGWSIADQIEHLAYFEGAAAQAIQDPDRFSASAELLLASPDFDAVTLNRTATGAELLEQWRRKRTRLVSLIESLEPGTRIPWYGPPMSVNSFLTARLMETWAHGQDVVEALGVARQPTDRLAHIVRMGFVTRGWTYANRDLQQPSAAVRLELDAPSGTTWREGPDDAEETITGPAIDFCLVVTQRRHVDDTELIASGSAARDWLERAQAFAGPPTNGPAASGKER